MYLIVGLGNPGLKYKKTRHNAGYMAIDALAQKLKVAFRKKAFSGITAEGFIGGEKVLLLKPLTYMNLSGISVLEAMEYYNIADEKLVIICDDVDLPLGKLRIKPNGSAGTHNGMRSIISKIHTLDFPRIRIGIGKPSGNIDLVAHVIQKMEKDTFKALQHMADIAADATWELVEYGIEVAQQKYNGYKVDEERL